jgi:uncharacterized protein DUF1844
MSEEKPGFTVKDRRIFAEKDEDVKNKEAEKEPPKQEVKEDAKEESVSAEEQKTEPKINFATFIISLNASALLYFGAMEDFVSGKKVKNLPIGKQTIDILGMFEEKTKGNLSKEEENLLKNILYDLRMIYVKEQE